MYANLFAKIGHTPEPIINGTVAYAKIYKTRITLDVQIAKISRIFYILWQFNIIIMKILYVLSVRLYIYILGMWNINKYYVLSIRLDNIRVVEL